MRIGLAYNEKPEPTSNLDDAFVEWDDRSTIEAVEQALSLFGDVARLEADAFFPQKVALARPHLVFNMAEGLHGPNREAHVPAICEFLNVPCTASDSLTLALALHKTRTKQILAQCGVATAPFAEVGHLDDLGDELVPERERTLERRGAGDDRGVEVARRHGQRADQRLRRTVHGGLGDVAPLHAPRLDEGQFAHLRP